MKKKHTFLHRLQWKMTLSYAIVTAGTLIMLVIFLIGIILVVESQVSSRLKDSLYWSKTAFQDNVPSLMDDPESLQAWLERVYDSGFELTDFKSYVVREALDYANVIDTGSPIFVLDLNLNLIAAVPLENQYLVGKPYENLVINDMSLETIIEAALIGDKNYVNQSLMLVDGSYICAFPLRQNDGEPIVAIVIYRIKPISFITPTNFDIYKNYSIAIISLILFVALPVGAVFGWFVSRKLRKRLVSLSMISQAWSKGNFSVKSYDTSKDEIGELCANLNIMADQLQALIHTRDALIRSEERNRLARDLHDTVKQQTYASRMQLSAAKNLIASDANSAAGHLDTALQLNRETQQEINLIITELRPIALETKGLSQALLDYINRWQMHTGIIVRTFMSGEYPLPVEIEQTLYRVCQEALSNVARHSGATAVELTLNRRIDKIKLSIVDNGHGFDQTSIATSSYGLTSMRQRLAEINGILSIESDQFIGTRIIAEVSI